MTDPIEAVALAIRKAQAQAPYMMFDYSGYDGEKPPHVIRDAEENIVFRSNDRVEAAKEYNRLNEAFVSRAAIAAYTKAVSGRPIGKQRRYQLSDGTWTEWLNGVCVLGMNLPVEERDIFAAPQPAVSTETDSGYARIIGLFDQDDTCASFLRPDSDGGFTGAIYDMAREIERLRPEPEGQEQAQ